MINSNLEKPTDLLSLERIAIERDAVWLRQAAHVLIDLAAKIEAESSEGTVHLGFCDLTINHPKGNRSGAAITSTLKDRDIPKNRAMTSPAT